MQLIDSLLHQERRQELESGGGAPVKIGGAHSLPFLSLLLPSSPPLAIAPPFSLLLPSSPFPFSSLFPFPFRGPTPPPNTARGSGGAL